MVTWCVFACFCALFACFCALLEDSGSRGNVTRVLWLALGILECWIDCALFGGNCRQGFDRIPGERDRRFDGSGCARNDKFAEGAG